MPKEQFNIDNIPYMKKKDAERQLVEKTEEMKKNFEQAEKGWEDASQELEFETILEDKVEEGKLKEKERITQQEKLKKMREEILFGKKGEAGTIAEMKKNLEASEAEWEKIGEDLDWRAREEEARQILGEEGIEAIERLRREATGEIETKEKPEPKISQEKVIINMPEAEEYEKEEAKNREREFENIPYIKKKDAERQLVERTEEMNKNFEQAKKGWENASQELEFEKILENKVAEYQKKPEEDLNNLFKKDEVEEIFELTKKKKKSSSEVIMEEQETIPSKQEKISLTELDDRVHMLWNAMDAVLQDAAMYKPTKQEKKAMGKWVKKGQGVEDWPLDDVVTVENYKERLAKYGIIDLIDESAIEPHNDAYAVISKQYKKYREELEKRIKHAKLRQLEKLEENAPVITRTEMKQNDEAISAEEEPSPIIPSETKISSKQKKISEEGIDVDVSEFETQEEKKDDGEIENKKKTPELLIKDANDIEELKEIIKNIKEIDDKFIDILDKIWKRQIPIDAITRKFGLRKKMEYLMDDRQISEKHTWVKENGRTVEKYIAVDENGSRHWIPVHETLYSMGIGKIKK